MGLFLGSVAFALVLSFFCSLSEATVLSLTPGEVAGLTQRHPRIGKIWNGFKAAIDRPIVVILVLNTVAQTLGATIAGAQFQKVWGGHGLAWFTLAFILSILFFTEILPKTLGVEYRRRVATFMALPLHYLVVLFQPLIFVAGFIKRPFTKDRRPAKSLALDELRALAAYARFSKEIGIYQEKIIQEASRLSQKKAADVMIPAKEIVYFETNKSLEALILKAHLDPHTRFPICREGDIHQILGYINFKELLFFSKNNPQKPSLEGIIRPVRFVSPKTPLLQLLRGFIEEHIHIAIVQNSEGKTMGIITLEDIIEEFLGEIEDEFDRLPKWVHSLAGGTWTVGGGIYWGELARRINRPLDPFSGTLSDWILSQAKGKIRTGTSVTSRGLDFIIRRVRRGKIFEVTILPHGSVPQAFFPNR